MRNIISNRLTEKQKEDEENQKKLNQKKYYLDAQELLERFFQRKKLSQNKIPELVDKIKYTQNKYIWMKAALGIMTTDTQNPKWRWKSVQLEVRE